MQGPKVFAASDKDPVDRASTRSQPKRRPGSSYGATGRPQTRDQATWGANYEYLVDGGPRELTQL